MDFIQSRVFSENPVKAIRESFIPFFGRVSDELLSPKELESKLKDIENSQDWFSNNFSTYSIYFRRNYFKISRH